MFVWVLSMLYLYMPQQLFWLYETQSAMLAHLVGYWSQLTSFERAFSLFNFLAKKLVYSWFVAMVFSYLPVDELFSYQFYNAINYWFTYGLYFTQAGFNFRVAVFRARAMVYTIAAWVSAGVYWSQFVYIVYAIRNRTLGVRDMFITWVFSGIHFSRLVYIVHTLHATREVVQDLYLMGQLYIALGLYWAQFTQLGLALRRVVDTGLCIFFICKTWASSGFCIPQFNRFASTLPRYHLHFRIWLILWEIKIVVIVYWLWNITSPAFVVALGYVLAGSYKQILESIRTMDVLRRTQFFFTIVIVWINIIKIGDNLDIYSFLTSIDQFSPKAIIWNLFGCLWYWDRHYFVNNLAATGLEDIWCNLILVLILVPIKTTKMTLSKFVIIMSQYINGYMSPTFMLWNTCIIFHEWDAIEFPSDVHYCVIYIRGDPVLRYLVATLYGSEYSRTLITDIIRTREQLDTIQSNFFITVIATTRLLSFSCFDPTYALTTFANYSSLNHHLELF